MTEADFAEIEKIGFYPFMKAVENEIIDRALALSRGQVAAAATRLHLRRTTLSEMVRRRNRESRYRNPPKTKEKKPNPRTVSEEIHEFLRKC